MPGVQKKFETFFPDNRISYMRQQELYQQSWEDPEHPLKKFGGDPFTKNAAWCRVGVSFVAWALRQGHLRERGDGLLQVASRQAVAG